MRVTKIEDSPNGDIKITHEGVTLKIYVSPPNKKNKKSYLVIQMFKKEQNLSIGLSSDLAYGVSRIIQKRITEL